jgi:hypothetical protein
VSEAVKPVSDVIQMNGEYFSLCAVLRVLRGYFTSALLTQRLKQRQKQKTYSNNAELHHIRLGLLKQVRRAIPAFRSFNRTF